MKGGTQRKLDQFVVDIEFLLIGIIHRVAGIPQFWLSLRRGTEFQNKNASYQQHAPHLKFALYERV